MITAVEPKKLRYWSFVHRRVLAPGGAMDAMGT